MKKAIKKEKKSNELFNSFQSSSGSPGLGHMGGSSKVKTIRNASHNTISFFIDFLLCICQIKCYPTHYIPSARNSSPSFDLG